MNRKTVNDSGGRFDDGFDDALGQWIVHIRRHLHRFPELSNEEHRTAAYIREKLTEIGVTSQAVGHTGVVAEIGESDGQPPGVGLRADMDALPIEERTGVSFASVHAGCMHACGHDGHVAMLLGAAALLQRAGVTGGRVRLIFQPAEERGNGAEQLIGQGILDGLGAVFCGHIDTRYPSGVITVDSGLICAHADAFSIVVHGRGGHAARPHEASDAIVAAANLVMAIQTLVSREVDPRLAEVITIGRFQAGTAHNVIADEAVLQGTIRSTDTVTRTRTIDGLQRILRGLETMYAVHCRLEFEELLPAVVNDPLAAHCARLAAHQVVGPDAVISQGLPSLGGEDFAFYQQAVPGCMVRFGAALTAGGGPAHSDTFQFDERCLAIGARWLAGVARLWLNRPEVLHH
ncbi:M20 metallopeptidase family protein [Desulfofustis limnaeus]|nr:amidohydrolase [Desulfofustis limnaeus]MDX9896481.1 amidohydrolase [Desulfofustis sp.]